MKKTALIFLSMAVSVGLSAKALYVNDSLTTDLKITNKSSVYFVFSEAISDITYDIENEKGLKVEQKAPNEYIVSFKKGGEYRKVEGVEQPALARVIHSDVPSEIFFKSLGSDYKYIFRLIPSDDEKELIYEIHPKGSDNTLIINGDNTRVALKNPKNDLDVTYVHSGDILKYTKFENDVYFLEDGSTILKSLVTDLGNGGAGKKYSQTQQKKEIYAIEKKSSYRQGLISLNKSVFEDKKDDFYKKYKNENVNKAVYEDAEMIITHLVRKTGATYIQDIYEIQSKQDNLFLSEAYLEKFKNLEPLKLKKRLISMKKDVTLNRDEKTLLAIIKEI